MYLVSVVAGARSLTAAVIEVNPWGVMSASGKPSGLYVDAATILANQAGLAMQPVLLPYLRVPLVLSNGEADFTIITENDTLNREAIKVGLVQRLQLVAFTLKARRIQQLADLQQLRIAVLRGTAYPQQLAPILTATFSPVDNYDQAFLMLLKGRVDAVVGVDQGLRYAWRSNPRLKAQEESLATPIALDTIATNLYISRRTDPLLQRRLRLAYQAAVKQHLFDRVFSSYR